MLIREALQWGQSLLNSGSSRLDAEVLLAHVLQVGRVYLISHDDEMLSSAQEAHFQALMASRESGTPVAHLTGTREFWSLPIIVSPATLIPRPDTECLIEWVLELALSAQSRVLDMGTGTGAIACALASERPTWQITGTDVSMDAVNLAKRNVTHLNLPNVEILQSDWFSALAKHKFDLIVSNPPYIPANDPHLSRGDVRFEPASALVSGPDGLDDIRVILAEAKLHLNNGAWVGLEHGYDQGESVCTLFQQLGYSDIETLQDLGGNDRISVGSWKP